MGKITDPDKQIKKRKTVKGVLNEVRRLLSDYENWVQGDWEEEKDDGSFCYCLNGAIDAASATPELAAEVKLAVDKNIPRRWLANPLKKLKEWALKDGHYIADAETWNVEEPIIGLNDGNYHRHSKNAWKAVLNVVDKARGAA
jgi:hypothetical protein